MLRLKCYQGQSFQNKICQCKVLLEQYACIDIFLDIVLLPFFVFSVFVICHFRETDILMLSVVGEFETEYFWLKVNVIKKNANSNKSANHL